MESYPILSSYINDAGMVLGFILEWSDFLRIPLKRNGQRTIIGIDGANLPKLAAHFISIYTCVYKIVR